MAILRRILAKEIISEPHFGASQIYKTYLKVISMKSYSNYGQKLSLFAIAATNIEFQ